MGFLSRFFGGGTKAPEPMRDIAALATPLASRALQAVLTPRSTNSYFLGNPQLDQNAAWPNRKGRRLDFLARIDLAEIASVHGLPWLPADGSLLFFYDRKEGPWGSNLDERDGWSVLLQPSRPTPDPLKSRGMTFRAIDTLPAPERPQVEALDLNDSEFEAYCELSEARLGGEPAHQVGGFTMAIQGDHLELNCQLASNGVDVHKRGAYESARAKELEAGAAEWKLLFQITSDDRLDFNWGDGGTLYFMIREEDALARRFDRVWLSCQCH